MKKYSWLEIETLVHYKQDAPQWLYDASDVDALVGHLRAQVEIAIHAMHAAISKAEWQARTNAELNQHMERIAGLEREVANAREFICRRCGIRQDAPTSGAATF
jgi:hypothetical protein